MDKMHGKEKMVRTQWYGQRGADKIIMVTMFLDLNSIEFNLYLVTKSHKEVGLINTKRKPKGLKASMNVII